MNGRVVTEEQLQEIRKSRKINVILRNPEAVPIAEPSKEPQFNGKTLLREQGQLAEIFKELDQMIGLEEIKELVYQLYALIQVGQMRTEAGLAANSQVYHMVFKGNPGTGKTTVARLMGRLFQALGIISKGHMIEVERADLVGEYIGHTAIKTRDMIKKALGGILFIDEAYSLARGGEKDFGREAIDTMVKAMEDHKNQFVLILAGYSEEMDLFLRANPGLPSRFPIQIEFPDYSVEQLLQIAEWMIRERDYVFSAASIEKLKQHLTMEKAAAGFHTFSNARYVRNIIERSIRHHAVRLLNLRGNAPNRQELMTIRPDDFRLDKKTIY